MVHSKYFLVFLVFNFTFPCYGLKILMVTDFFPHPTRPFIDKQIEGLLEDGACSIDIFAKKPYPVVIPDNMSLPSLKVIYKNIPKLDSYDIVYCQFGHLSPQFAQLKQRKNYKWKLVVAFRGYDATAVLKEDLHFYDLVFKEGTLFLPVCDFFKNNLINAGCPPNKIVVHHSAINCDFFSYKQRQRPKNNPTRIVTVGRLNLLKGYEYSIKAVAKLIRRGINIEYIIVGTGNLGKTLGNLILQLGCEGRIHCVGKKSHKEIIDLLNNAHIFLLASATTPAGITEGIPNVLMEAMATGLPIISTYHAGIPELVQEGVSGFLVPEKDINALAFKLEYLIKHVELWPLLGLAGRQHIIKEHNIKIMNKKLKEMFLRII